MIFELVRHDDAVWLGLRVAVLNLVLLPLLPAGVDLSTVLSVEVAGMCGLFLGMRKSRALLPRATLFEISMPISGRQLFLARVLGLQAMVWLPALSALVALVLRGGTANHMIPDVWKGAFIAFLGVLLPVCVRLPECSLPAWLNAALLAGVAGAGAAAWCLLPAGVVVILFGAAGAAVLLKAWTAVPQSFQVAPLEAASAPRRIALPAIVPAHWRPVLRSAFSWTAILLCALMAMLAPSGGELYFLPMFGIQLYAQSRHRLRWVSALAISPRSLLLITLAASLGPLVGGVVVGTYFGPGARPVVGAGPVTGDGHDWPKVPLEFWRRAPGGVPSRSQTTSHTRPTTASESAQPPTTSEG